MQKPEPCAGTQAKVSPSADVAPGPAVRVVAEERSDGGGPRMTLLDVRRTKARLLQVRHELRKRPFLAPSKERRLTDERDKLLAKLRGAGW